MAKLVLLSSALAVMFLCKSLQLAVSLQQKTPLPSSPHRKFASDKNSQLVGVEAVSHHQNNELSSASEQHSELSVGASSTSRRRRALGYALMAMISVGLNLSTTATREAEAISNPLNLKGSFWETGELYRKSDIALPSDPDELLSSLIEAGAVLESLNDVALEGRFEDLSRSLRGGAISESKLRLRGYAIIDMIEDEKQEYLASDLFRTFLRDFALLDATVDAAARQAKIDGGLVETVGLAVVSPFSAANEVARISQEPTFGKDARINAIASLGECIKSLKAFNKFAGDAI